MPESSQAAPQSLRPPAVLSRACRLYWENWRTLLSLSALGVCLYAVGLVLAWAGGNFLWWLGHSLIFPCAILFLWAGAALNVSADGALRGEQMTVRAALARAAPRFWWYARAAVLSVLAWWVGLLVVIVGGLYTGTAFALAGPVAVLEEPSGRPGALRRSMHLVRENALSVLLIILVLWASCGVIGVGAYLLFRAHPAAARLVACLGWVLVWPFWSTVHVVLYRRLRSEGKREPEGERPGAGSCLLGCGLAVLLTLAGVGLTVAWTYGLRKTMSDRKPPYEHSYMFPSTAEPELDGVEVALSGGWEASSWDQPGYRLSNSEGLGPENIRLWSRPLYEATDAQRLTEQTAARVQDLSVEVFGPDIPREVPYNARSTERLELGGRPWWHHTLTWRPDDAEPPAEVRKDHFFTVFGDRVVVVTAFDAYLATPEEEYQESVEADLSAVKGLISGLRISPAARTPEETR